MTADKRTRPSGNLSVWARVAFQPFQRSRQAINPLLELLYIWNG